jgi:phosphatidylglycerophosphatase A
LSFGLLYTTIDPFTNYIHLILAALSYILGTYAINKLIPIWGDDPGKIVIDEMCGMWLALVLTPPSILYYIIAFALFRFFDITKVLGIGRLDKIKNEHGVMLDDVLAGLYTGLITYLLYHFDLIPI